MSKVFWQTIAMQIVGILCVSWQDGIENVAQQWQLIVAMLQGLPYRNKVAKILQEQPHRRLFTREGLVAVPRMAVVEGSAGNGNIDDQADSFVKASLIANELLAAEIMPEVVTNGPADLLPTELRSAILKLENPHDLLGRTDAFFTWSRTEKARASANYSDIAADFFRFTGADKAYLSEIVVGRLRQMGMHAVIPVKKRVDGKKMKVFYEFFQELIEWFDQRQPAFTRNIACVRMESRSSLS